MSSSSVRNSSTLYAQATGAFTDAELDAVERYCEGLPQIKAPLGGDAEGGSYDAKRNTKVAAIERSAEAEWIYDRLSRATTELNRKGYQFDLIGFKEPFQFMVYRGDEASHFDWHVDQNPFAVPRKLSLTVQLTKPSDYEGCDLQFYAGNNVETASRERGAVICFPSYVLHRVTPIISGTRKSLVAWAAGPKFR